MSRITNVPFVLESIKSNTIPFLVLQIDWIDIGQKSYSDRLGSDFENPACAPTGAIPRVTDWGRYKISLKDGQISARDEVRLKIADQDREIFDHLTESFQQRVPARIYAMYDAPQLSWPTNRVVLFEGALMPFTWSEDPSEVEIRIEDSSRRMKVNVGKRAFRSVFPTVHVEHEDTPLPIPWGRAQRIHARLIQVPWRTVSRSGATASPPPITMPILNHPTELGVLTGPTNPVDAWLGSDEVEGYFTQSLDPDNVPSTYTITSTAFSTLGTAPYSYVDGFTLHFERERQQPRFLEITDLLTVGDQARIFNIATSTWSLVTINNFGPGGVGGFSAFSDHIWRFVSLSSIPPANGIIQFIDAASVRRPWPAGTVLRARGDGEKYVYLFSMLPVQALHRVEGFGTIRDEAGDNLQEFVFINNVLYTSNLSDSTYAGALGHNVATISFSQSPRRLVPELQDISIYVTCTGVAPTAGDGTGSSHPANIIQEYLTSPHLINQTGVTIPTIDTLSFDQWRLDDPTARYDFAQIEIQDGLEWMQRLAVQSHRVIQFAFGRISIVELLNTVPVTPTTQIAATLRIENTVKLRQTSVKDLISHVVGQWRVDWDNREGPSGQVVVVFNSTLRDTYGLNKRDMQIFVYRDRADVIAELTFWQARWGSVWELLEVGTVLVFRVLAPGGTVLMGAYTDGEGNVLFDGTEAYQCWQVDENAGRATRAPTIKITLARPLFLF